MQNAIKAARLHHAYLFTGARGVGKTTVARILAKALNCTERSAAPEPCNDCPSCASITAGRSLDIQEIDGASNTGVDDVREIRERVKYLPASGRYKVYIIDEVHMLSNAAFNALLKTLEEPPPHVIFVFATTEPEKIPLTILSRCQRYDFRRVSVGRITSVLEKIAVEEGIDASPEALHCLAFEAQGSLRDAQSLFDQAVAFTGANISLDALRDLLGFTDRRTILSFIEKVIEKDSAGLLVIIGDAFKCGTNLARFSQDVLDILRHLWVISSCGEIPSGHDLPQADVEGLKKLAATATLTEFQQWFAIAYRAVDDIARSKTPKLALEAMALQLAQVGPAQPVDELLARVEEMMKCEAPRPTSAPQRADVTHVTAETPVTTGYSENIWSSFLSHVRSVKPQLASILEHGECVTATSSLVELRYAKDSIYGEMLKETDRMLQVEKALKEKLGPACRLVVSTAEGASATELKRQEMEKKQIRQRQSREAAMEHPLVREAANIFGADIVEVRTLDKPT